jgi:hypothetical protein
VGDRFFSVRWPIGSLPLAEQAGSREGGAVPSYSQSVKDRARRFLPASTWSTIDWGLLYAGIAKDSSSSSIQSISAGRKRGMLLCITLCQKREGALENLPLTEREGSTVQEGGTTVKEKGRHDTISQSYHSQSVSHSLLVAARASLGTFSQRVPECL